MKKKSSLSKVIKEAADRFDGRPIYRASIDGRMEIETKPISEPKTNYELKLEKLIDLASKLRRGCDCEYDYRCSNCSMIISVSDLAEELKHKKNK
jgi:hypothetical protein